MSPQPVHSNQMLDAALFYASKGWHVFPCKHHDKLPAVKWADVATTDPKQITAWFTQLPQYNIGIITGAVSGIVVVDVDKGHDGEESMLDLVASYNVIPHTVESLTGGGGRHLIFAHPGIEIRNSASKLGPGLDIRGDGGYIVAPPSIHPSGKAYMWEISSKPSQTPLAPLPGWLIELLQRPDQENEKVPAPVIPGTILAGSRNLTLTSLAGSMRRRGMDSESIFAALQVENEKHCNPPLPEDDVLLIAKSVNRYDPTTPPQAKKEIEYHEPRNAFEIHFEFINLLDHLEGRSIKTWLPAMDRCMGGLERQTLTVLAARPSMGKSTLAWQIARNIATNKQKVFFYSLEMSATSLWAKAACGSLGIRWRDVRAGDITPEQDEAIRMKSSELIDLYNQDLLIDDYCNSSTTIRAGVERYKPDVVIVDHLRLVGDRDDSEVKRLGMVTQELKNIAKECNCAVLCLAQLNRKTEDREDKRPTLADLRDSGQIEENADVVLMMYREDYYEPLAKGPDTPTEILVRKFRDDILAQQINLYFNKAQQWFVDKSEVAERKDYHDDR